MLCDRCRPTRRLRGLLCTALQLQPCHSPHSCNSTARTAASARGERHGFFPRVVALGRGAAQTQLRSVLQQCNVSKPFVVTDKNLEALTRNVLDSNDVSGEIYADEVDEPTSDRVDAMAAALSSSGADGVVAIGGGSPLDAAKLAVVLSENGGKCRDYKAPVLTDTATKAPMVAVPTTAGTGAEVTSYAVVTDSSSGEKMLWRRRGVRAGRGVW